MNIWFVHAFKSILWGWVSHVIVIFSLAIALDCGMNSAHPFSIVARPEMQQKALLMLMVIIPLALFSSQYSLLRKWRWNGELALITYLNLSWRKMLMAHLCAWLVIFSNWIILKEWAWPKLIQKYPGIIQKEIQPIRLEGSYGSLILQPITPNAEIVEILLHQENNWIHGYRAYWYNFSWKVKPLEDGPVSTAINSQNLITQEILTDTMRGETKNSNFSPLLAQVLNQPLKNPQQLFEQNQLYHTASTLELMNENNHHAWQEITKRMLLYTWALIFFNAFWLISLRLSKHLEKIALWGMVIFFGLSLCLDMLI